MWDRSSCARVRRRTGWPQRPRPKGLKLGIRIHCLLPTLNPNTDLGRAAVAAYAERAGVSIDEFAKRLAPHLTPAIMGDAVVELYSDPARWDKLAYQIGGAGLKPLK